MHDEQHMYRVQWGPLWRCLARLCLRLDRRETLLTALCYGGGPPQVAQVPLHQAVQTWCEEIATELVQKTHTDNAWPGWAALVPLFGDTQRLCKELEQQAQAICNADDQAKTRHLGQVLRHYFTGRRDALDGAGPTRLEVWRKIDRIQRDLQKLRHYDAFPELVADICDEIQRQRVKDAPKTVEGVLSYFYEFDATYTVPYEEELHALEALEALTDRDWRLDLKRCLAQLPADLRHAVEGQYGLAPTLRTHEGHFHQPPPRTLRWRGQKALTFLRECLNG